jgi:hypothetical protein
VFVEMPVYEFKRAAVAGSEATAGEARADASQTTESLVEMAVCCAWCGRFQSRNCWVDPAPFPEPERTTYGMCPECFCSYSAEHFATPSAARRRYDRCVSGLPLADTVRRLRPNLEGFDALVEAVWGRVASRRPHVPEAGTSVSCGRSRGADHALPARRLHGEWAV